jgi:NADPH-dependent 2,4-dienoyl-CoA reductase/sulfur reductase-like enzyme
MGAAVSGFHGDNGADLRCGVGVAGLEGSDRVERVRLADGSAVEADVVVVGIGVAPNVMWLEGSGLELANGIVCDATCLAAPDVVAAGDVARWPNALFDGELMRVEHWDNAIFQGQAAANTILDGDAAAAYAPVPWFWSDQYGHKLQFAGRSAGFDHVQLVHGSVDERKFVALYGRAGRLIGVLGVGRARLVMKYRALIEQRATWDDALARSLEL